MQRQHKREENTHIWNCLKASNFFRIYIFIVWGNQQEIYARLRVEPLKGLNILPSTVWTGCNCPIYLYWNIAGKRRWTSQARLYWQRPEFKIIRNVYEEHCMCFNKQMLLLCVIQPFLVNRDGFRSSHFLYVTEPMIFFPPNEEVQTLKVSKKCTAQ